MFCLSFSALLITSGVFATTFASENNKKSPLVYSARCEARCFSKTGQSVCNGTCLKACLKPCMDVANFHKVKSCTQFCKECVKSRENKACKTSCKILLRLHNTGGGKGQAKHLLPDRPTNVKVSSLSIRKRSYHLIRWSYQSTRQDVQQPVFIIETKYYKENPYFESEWIYIKKTRDTTIQVTPRPDTWSIYRIMSVNEYGSSNYSNHTKPIYTMPNRPTAPRDFRILYQLRRKDKVSVKLAWSKPQDLEIPVHRYRLFWSPRLDRHTEQLHSLRVNHIKLKGNTHTYTLHGLMLNITYQFELQAICHYNGKRLRSSRVFLTVRTLDKEPLKPRLPFTLIKKKKEIKMAKNFKTKQSNTMIRALKPRTLKPNEIKLSPKKCSPTQGAASMEGLKSAASARNTIIGGIVFTAVVMVKLLNH